MTRPTRTPPNLSRAGTLSPWPTKPSPRRWNDEQWAAYWPKRERLTETVSPYLLEIAGARPGQRVIDVGCGGGPLTLALAQLVAPDGEAVGIDISSPLLELARRRAEQARVHNARFVQMDVQTTSTREEPFDLAVSQFGVMFFDEPTAAFGAIRGLLAAAGASSFACWQDVERNPWHVRYRPSAVAPAAADPSAREEPGRPVRVRRRRVRARPPRRSGVHLGRGHAVRDDGAGPGRRRRRPFPAPVHGGRRPRTRTRRWRWSSAIWPGSLSGRTPMSIPLAFRVYEAVNA